MSDGDVMHTVSAANAAEVAKAVKAGDLPGPAKSLAEALARIYADGGRYVQKTGQMQGGPARYSYAKEGDFIAAIRPLMETHGVTVAPRDMEIVTNETFERKNGGTAYRVVLRVTFRFLHSSGDALDVQTIGEGTDSGDKAFNKAMTAAMKYCLRQTFCVETGDDPDDHPGHEQERAAPAKPAANNPQLVARLTQRFAQVKNPTELETVYVEVQGQARAGHLSEADRQALRVVAAETDDRVNGKARK